MSLYGDEIRIGGVPCGLVTRGSGNGRYLAVFEREYAALEDIEGISWDEPEVQGDCILPIGYGFTVTGISYCFSTRSYMVELQVARQYLGDVAGYEARIGELEADLQDKAQELDRKEAAMQEQAETLTRQEQIMAQQADDLEEKDNTIQEQAAAIQTQAAELAEKEAAIQALEESGTARQVTEQLEAAYQEGVESNG